MDESSAKQWLTLQIDRFKKRSENALSPAELPEYRQERARRWPKRSGLSEHRDGRGALNEYHRARFETRRHEALTPGKSQIIAGLKFIKQRGGEDVRRRPTEEYQKRVWNPYKKRYEWTRATKWKKKAMFVAPREVLYTTSLYSTEKAVLFILYDSICPWELHVRGQFVVRGVTQERIAAILDLTPGHVCKIIQSLEAKGFLKKWRLGDRQPNLYKLAAYHNGQWTFAALSNRSGRSRAQSYLGKSLIDVGWDKYLSQPVRRRRRAERAEFDAAEEKLRRDRQRTRTADTGLKALSSGVDWREDMRQAQAEAAAEHCGPPEDVDNADPPS